MKFIDRVKGVIGMVLLLLVVYSIFGFGIYLGTWLIRVPLIQILTINGFLAPYMTLGIIAVVGWLIVKVFFKGS